MNWCMNEVYLSSIKRCTGIRQCSTAHLFQRQIMYYFVASVKPQYLLRNIGRPLALSELAVEQYRRLFSGYLLVTMVMSRNRPLKDYGPPYARLGLFLLFAIAFNACLCLSSPIGVNINVMACLSPSSAALVCCLRAPPFSTITCL